MIHFACLFNADRVSQCCWWLKVSINSYSQHELFIFQNKHRLKKPTSVNIEIHEGHILISQMTKLLKKNNMQAYV